MAVRKGDVDVLAFASLDTTEESCHYGVAGVETGGKVGDSDADFGRWAVAVAGDVH